MEMNTNEEYEKYDHNELTNKDDTASNSIAWKSIDDKLTRRRKIYLKNVEDFNKNEQYMALRPDLVN
jgi:hypothetical protein